MKTIRIAEEFKEDHISRIAGERLREMILSIWSSINRRDEKVELDFGGLIIASTSFFDEGIAKLALNEWTLEDFQKRITITNLNKRDYGVLKQVCEYRGWSF